MPASAWNGATVCRSSSVSETMSSPRLSCTEMSAIRPSGAIAGMSPPMVDSGVSRTGLPPPSAATENVARWPSDE